MRDISFWLFNFTFCLLFRESRLGMKSENCYKREWPEHHHERVTWWQMNRCDNCEKSLDRFICTLTFLSCELNLAKKRSKLLENCSHDFFFFSIVSLALKTFFFSSGREKLWKFSSMKLFLRSSLPKRIITLHFSGSDCSMLPSLNYSLKSLPNRIIAVWL